MLKCKCIVSLAWPPAANIQLPAYSHAPEWFKSTLYQLREVLVFNCPTCKGRENTSASIQPSVSSATQQGQQAATHPLLPKSSFIWCTWSAVTQSSIYSAHRMLCHFIFTPLNPPDADVHWCPVKHTWKPFKDHSNQIAPIQKGIHSGTSTMRWRQQDSSPGDQFYCLLVSQVRKLAAHCSKVGREAALFIVFSAVTGKLNWVCHKYRRGILKSCFI